MIAFFQSCCDYKDENVDQSSKREEKIKINEETENKGEGSRRGDYYVGEVFRRPDYSKTAVETAMERLEDAFCLRVKKNDKNLGKFFEGHYWPGDVSYNLSSDHLMVASYIDPKNREILPLTAVRRNTIFGEYDWYGHEEIKKASTRIKLVDDMYKFQKRELESKEERVCIQYIHRMGTSYVNENVFVPFRGRDGDVTVNWYYLISKLPSTYQCLSLVGNLGIITRTLIEPKFVKYYYLKYEEYGKSKREEEIRSGIRDSKGEKEEKEIEGGEQLYLERGEILDFRDAYSRKHLER